MSSLLYWGQSAALTRAEVAEKSESTLRHAAEVARAKEIDRAARTALEQANRDLEEDRVPDGLAWLVQAARKDPFSPVIAPRIASVLASNAYLLPDGAPFESGSRVVATRFARDGAYVFRWHNRWYDARVRRGERKLGAGDSFGPSEWGQVEEIDIQASATGVERIGCH